MRFRDMQAQDDRDRELQRLIDDIDRDSAIENDRVMRIHPVFDWPMAQPSKPTKCSTWQMLVSEFLDLADDVCIGWGYSGYVEYLEKGGNKNTLLNELNRILELLGEEIDDR